MGRLDGKVVVLTGASGGLGKQAAIRLAEEGARLAICARTEARLMETKALCEAAGSEVFAMRADVSRLEDLKAFVEGTVARFGTIDVLVNNAIAIPDPHPFMDHTVATLDAALHSGLHSIWHMMQLCFPYLKAQQGAVINFGAGAGTRGLAGWTAYSTVKAAISGLSMSVAKEWGEHNIRVNVICPAGLTENSRAKLADRPTELRQWAINAMSQNALGRTGDPYEDIAPAVVFLASDDARFITGQSIHVDGGLTIHA
jgi:NAD(P)-dependent dehydrogenase (short-subunit alcohol dehydrogenase family)